MLHTAFTFQGLFGGLGLEGRGVN